MIACSNDLRRFNVIFVNLPDLQLWQGTALHTHLICDVASFPSQGEWPVIMGKGVKELWGVFACHIFIDNHIVKWTFSFIIIISMTDMEWPIWSNRYCMTDVVWAILYDRYCMTDIVWSILYDRYVRSSFGCPRQLLFGVYVRAIRVN